VECLGKVLHKSATIPLWLLVTLAWASRGAQAVLAGAGSDSHTQARLAERYGARPGRGNLLDLDPPPGKPDPTGAAPASEALRWVRGE
jgi:hypothetical protein